MGLYKRKDSPIWWMSFSYNRRQYQRSTGTADRRLAEAILAKVKTQIVEGKWFEIDQAKQHTFDEMMERFLREHSRINRPGAHKNDKTYVRHLSEFFSGLTLDQITPQLISEYKNKRLSEGKSPQTVKHELNCLNIAFNLAMKEWDWINYNPCLKVSKPRVNNQILRWLTPEEEERLMKASRGYLNGQLPDIITVALHTGMRQGEILRLKWKDIDLFRRTITVMQSKTHEPKTIPMTDTLFNLLLSKSKVVSMSGYVFHTGNGTRILQTNLQREFWKALKKAGIENFRFHDLRHTFATRLVQNGVDLYTVARLLGHKDVKTTQRYAHHCTESLGQSIKILDNFSAQKQPEKGVSPG